MGSPILISALVAIGSCCCAALVAFRCRSRGAYIAAKLLASAGFVAVALLGGATGSMWSAVVLGGLAIAAIGDGAMAAGGKRGFLAGLACFAAAYCAYAVAFLLHGVGSLVVVAPSLASGGLAAAGAWCYLRAHLPKRLRMFVVVYLTVMAVMLGVGVACAYFRSNWTLLAGVGLVAVSDIAVARERFVSPSFANKLAGLPAYYAGQTLVALAIGVLAA